MGAVGARIGGRDSQYGKRIALISCATDAGRVLFRMQESFPGRPWTPHPAVSEIRWCSPLLSSIRLTDGLDAASGARPSARRSLFPKISSISRRSASLTALGRDGGVAGPPLPNSHPSSSPLNQTCSLARYPSGAASAPSRCHEAQAEDGSAPSGDRLRTKQTQNS